MTRYPAEFHFWANRKKPSVKVASFFARNLLGFDPFPTNEKVEAFAASYYDGDPLAEAFVRDVVEPIGYPAARQLLSDALTHGIESIPEAPSSLINLFADINDEPEWLDWQQVELGAKVFRRYGSSVFEFAGAATLLSYAENSVSKALILSGGYKGESTKNRFLETASFWIDVSEAQGLRQGQAGREAAIAVRIMHVFVRRRLQEHSEWDTAAWGVPISQGDAVLTLMGGSVAPGLAMHVLGYRTSGREIEAMMHFWRYVGHIMGVRPRWYPAGIREGLQLLCVNFVKGANAAGQDGETLCKSFADAFAPAPSTEPEQSLRQRIRASLDYRLHLGYVRFFSLPGSTPSKSIPPAGLWALHPLLRFPFIFAAESLRRSFPAFDGIADTRARKQRKRWHSRMAKTRASYRPPETVSR